MVLPQGESTFVSGGEYSPPTGWLDKPLTPLPYAVVAEHMVTG